MAETDSATITLLVAAIASASTLAGVWLANRNSRELLKLQLSDQANNESRRIVREKAEELYELTDAWLKTIASNSLFVGGVMQGKLTYNQCLDLQIDHSNKNTHKFSRIEMLVDIYFKETKSVYTKITDARAVINEIISDHKKAYESGSFDGKKFLGPFNKAQSLLEMYGEEFKSVVAECARNA